MIINKWGLFEISHLKIKIKKSKVSLPIKIDKYALPIVYKKENPSVPITLPPVHELNLYK